MGIHPDLVDNLEDTESEAARKIRYERQVNIESMIYEQTGDDTSDVEMSPRLIGVSLEDRNRGIRTFLFGDLEKMKDDDPIGVRTQETFTTFSVLGGLKKVRFDYPESSAVRNILYPAYVETIDNIYAEVTEAGDGLAMDNRESPENRLEVPAEISERYAGVLHSIGGVIHPFIDGNGQTFRLAALSYLSELSPQVYHGACLPARYEKNMYSEDAVQVSVEARIPARKLKDIDNTEIRILKEIQKLYRPTIIEDDDGARRDKDLESWAQETYENLSDLKIPSSSGEPVDVSEALGGIEMSGNDWRKLLNAENDLIVKLEDMGINNYIWYEVIKARDEGHSIDQEMLPRIYIEYLINTNRGKKWLSNYVRTGEALDQSDVPEGLRWIEKLAQESFEEVGAQLVQMIQLKGFPIT